MAKKNVSVNPLIDSTGRAWPMLKSKCTICENREEAAGMIWYYHEQGAGAYHAIERRADGPRRSYHALFCIDPATGEARSYSGPLPSRYQAEAVLRHLAPDAVRLDGLPAFLR